MKLRTSKVCFTRLWKKKNKETLSLFVLGIRDVIADVLRCRCFWWRSSLFLSWTSSDDSNYLFCNFSWLHTMVFIFCQDLSYISCDIVWCYICIDLMDFANHDVDHLAYVNQVLNICFWYFVFFCHFLQASESVSFII